MTVSFRVFLPLVLATLLVMAALRVVDRPLKDAAVAPDGIISLQFAGDVPRAQAILDLWKSRGVLPQAAFSLGLDFLLPLLYSTSLALACFWSATVFRPASELLARIANGLAWAQWFAAALDVVENIAQTIMVFETVATSPLPQVAWWCAVPKFALVGAGLVCAAGGVLVWLLTRWR